MGNSNPVSWQAVSVIGTVHGIMERCVTIRLHPWRVRMSPTAMNRLRSELQCTVDSVVDSVFGLPIVVDDTCSIVTVEVVA